MTRLADSAYPHRLPAFFLSLTLPRKGQPFPPERRNCSHTFRGVIQLRLPSALQRYNTLDFPKKVVCQQGCCSPLLETQSQRGNPLWIPLVFVACVYTSLSRLVYFTISENTKIPQISFYERFAL